MKPLIFLFLIWSQGAGAQQLALLDRNFKEPFLLRDTFTIQDVAQGAFPLYTEDIPAVIAHLEVIARQLASPQVSHSEPETFAAQHAHLFLVRKNNLYSCVLQSSNKQFSVPMVVGRGTRKTTHRAISRFIEYLRQNRAVAQEHLLPQ
jgi:hypothetical protein